MKRSDREDSGLGDEAVANVDVASGEGDVALPTIRVTLVPDLLRLGHNLLMKTIDVFAKTNLTFSVLYC